MLLITRKNFSTDSVLNTLMVNAVNRGMLTAVCAAINMILVSQFLVALLVYLISRMTVYHEAEHLLLLYRTPVEWKT